MAISHQPPDDSPLGRLLSAPMRPELVWIGLRPARKTAMLHPGSAHFVAATGIEGDHYSTRRDGERQVTLIAEEALTAIASFLGKSSVQPDALRRNLVTRGINLTSLKARRFRIGTALLCGSGDCAPCSQMEAALGQGGYDAVRGHGGITARILESGIVRIGDAVTIENGDGS